MLELRNISKRFGNVLANDQVNIVVKPGTIHAIVGENGAGKSTAMRIAYGFYTADSGEIVVDGQVRQINSPHDAIALGIGMVHQHFMLVDTMSVAENIVLGSEPGSSLALDLQTAAQQITKLSEEFKLAVNPNTLVEDLSVGQQQRVELLKALYRHAKLLILDEPTAVLTPLEVEEFFHILRRMREQGKTVIIITHKLSEVLAISDEVTVMRDGKVVGRVQTKDTNAAQLARMMVGREVLLRVEKPDAKPGQTELEVKGLSVTSGDGTTKVNDVSFVVRRGEIVGIAGVEGNGQTELIEALARLRDPSSGEIQLESKPISYWQRPTGKSLQSALKTLWYVLLAENAIQLLIGPRDQFWRVAALTITRLAVQSILIWLLIYFIKQRAKWAPIVAGVLGLLSLLATARILTSAGIKGSDIVFALLNAALLIYVIVVAIKTHREFKAEEKSELAGTSARQLRELGAAHIPEDRHRRGLLLDFSLAENSILGVHYRPPIAAYAGGVFIDDNAVQTRTNEIIKHFDVRPANAALPARALSGGNQQKLIIGREFYVNPKLLLVSQPTRGVDIGAIEFIHRKLVALRDEGCAILLVSAELEEVTSLSDRLLIIHEGKIVGEVDPKVATLEEIGLLMTRGH